MTEGDKAFYRRRMREEVKKARAAETHQLRQLHLRWAMLYQERLDGTPKTITRALETKLRSAGLDVALLPDVGGPEMAVMLRAG